MTDPISPSPDKSEAKSGAWTDNQIFWYETIRTGVFWGALTLSGLLITDTVTQRQEYKKIIKADSIKHKSTIALDYLASAAKMQTMLGRYDKVNPVNCGYMNDVSGFFPQTTYSPEFCETQFLTDFAKISTKQFELKNAAAAFFKQEESEKFHIHMIAQYSYLHTLNVLGFISNDGTVIPPAIKNSKDFWVERQRVCASDKLCSAREDLLGTVMPESAETVELRKAAYCEFAESEGVTCLDKNVAN